VLSAKQTAAGDPLGYTTGYTYNNLSGALIEEMYPSGASSERARI